MKYALIREGGMVRRYHTEPHILRQQNNAEHQWNAAMLLLCLYGPDLPVAKKLRLLTWLLLHDVPERYAGDVPHPAKVGIPGFQEFLTDAEDVVATQMGLDLPPLSEDERIMVRVCDALEAAWYLFEEAYKGNLHALRCFLDQSAPYIEKLALNTAASEMWTDLKLRAQYLSREHPDLV